MQALREKYLQPPKSLREAAGRAWHPIHARTLDFNRRKQKAVTVEKMVLEDLLKFHEEYLTPNGVKSGMLCTQIWPGKELGRAAGMHQENKRPGEAEDPARDQRGAAGMQGCVAAEEVLLRPESVAAFQLRRTSFRDYRSVVVC